MLVTKQKKFVEGKLVTAVLDHKLAQNSVESLKHVERLLDQKDWADSLGCILGVEAFVPGTEPSSNQYLDITCELSDYETVRHQCSYIKYCGMHDGYRIQAQPNHPEYAQADLALARVGTYRNPSIRKA